MASSKGICESCVCMVVCSILRATGGMERCKHYHEVDRYTHKVRAEANQIVTTMRCGRCSAYVLEQDHVCPGCGARFNGEFV